MDIRPLRPILAISMMLFVLGCSSARTWTYPVTAPVDRTPFVDQSVAVPPLNDERIAENHNRVFLYLIPLMPYGWQELNQPEGPSMHLTSGLWQFKPGEDIAKALAAEVQNRHIFKEAFFTFRESEGELVLRGTLMSTLYDGRLFSYGLSAYGPLLWFIGLPAGTIKNDLALKLRLEDRSTQKTVWEKEYRTEHDHGAFWLYAMPEDFFYDTMLKELMPAILADLEEAVKNK